MRGQKVGHDRNTLEEVRDGGFDRLQVGEVELQGEGRLACDLSQIFDGFFDLLWIAACDVHRRIVVQQGL